jgi:hypothetical protein
MNHYEVAIGDGHAGFICERSEGREFRVLHSALGRCENVTRGSKVNCAVYWT